MISLPQAVRRAYDAGYVEAAAERRSCEERQERGLARAVALLIERSADPRWARQRALAYIRQRHAYGACDPSRTGIDRPEDGEQGDEGVQPSAWSITFFKGDTRYWDELWTRLFNSRTANWG